MVSSYNSNKNWLKNQALHITSVPLWDVKFSSCELNGLLAYLLEVKVNTKKKYEKYSQSAFLREWNNSLNSYTMAVSLAAYDSIISHRANTFKFLKVLRTFLLSSRNKKYKNKYKDIGIRILNTCDFPAGMRDLSG